MCKLLLVLATVAASLRAAEVSGRWMGAMDTNGSRALVYLTLSSKGQEITGTVATHDQSHKVAIENAELQGDRLSFRARDTDGREMEFRLTVSEHQMKGDLRVGNQVSDVSLSPVGANRVYNYVGGLDAQPVVLYKTDPEYTEEARAAKLRGTVVLQVEVEKNGTISSVRVVHRLGGGLDEKAIEAVKQWKFKPAYKRGVPVTSPATIEMNFRPL